MFYQFDLPVKLVIGDGCSRQMPEKVSLHGIKRVMCIYDKGVEQAGIVQPLIGMLREAKIQVTTYDEVLPDPPMETVLKASEIAKEAGPDAFVAIDGVSAIDTAKAVNALSKTHNICMPITESVNEILYDGRNPVEFVSLLMSRGAVEEVSGMNWLSE